MQHVVINYFNLAIHTLKATGLLHILCSDFK